MSTAEKKRFIFATGMDLTVALDVDLSKLTAELAHEINRFWTGADAVLAAADDDPIEAAARRAALVFLQHYLAYESIELAQRELDESEGWPPDRAHGITLAWCDVPSFDAADLERVRP